MFYTNTLDQLFFLISVCFSFSCFILSVWFRNSDVFPRLMGISFFMPFLLQTASFLAKNKTVSDTFANLSVPLLLLSILMLLILKPAKRHFGPAVFCMSVVSFALILMSYNWGAFQRLAARPDNILPAAIVLLLADMYLLKKETGAKSYVFWAVLLLTAGSISSSFLNAGLDTLLAPALEMAAYVLFAVYFYNEYYSNLITKIDDAEKKITRVNRSLDMEVKKRMLEIERINQNLVNISKTDGLSKAMNKGAILDSIENLIATRQKSEFSVLMFDIDDFKQINDTLGHVTGDKCIKSLAIIAKSNMREFDMIGRYGGDEFIIVLPGVTLNQAVQIAERFRKRVEATETPHYTISMGIASYPRDGTTVEALIEAADAGLYKSKDRGKNTISYKH